jgi:hypothetical protein
MLDEGRAATAMEEDRRGHLQETLLDDGIKTSNIIVVGCRIVGFVTEESLWNIYGMLFAIVR